MKRSDWRGSAAGVMLLVASRANIEMSSVTTVLESSIKTPSYNPPPTTKPTPLVTRWNGRKFYCVFVAGNVLVKVNVLLLYGMGYLGQTAAAGFCYLGGLSSGVLLVAMRARRTHARTRGAWSQKVSLERNGHRAISTTDRKAHRGSTEFDQTVSQAWAPRFTNAIEYQSPVVCYSMSAGRLFT